MSYDAYFAKGKAHKVCEDYAFARPEVAVVSDGCSSSPDTDWGARFLCQSALLRAAGLGAWEEAGQAMMVDAKLMQESCRLPVDCLDATLLAIVPGAEPHVRVWGDGVVVMRYRESGDLLVHIIEYDSNAPAYPSYLLSESRYAVYMANTGRAKRTLVLKHVNSGGTVAGESVTDLTGFPLDGDVLPIDPNLFDLVAVFTDGVQSFQRREGRHLVPVDVLEVLGHLNFRGQGEFVTRTMRWFLNKFCSKEGWQHTDDLGVAAMLFEPLIAEEAA